MERVTAEGEFLDADGAALAKASLPPAWVAPAPAELRWSGGRLTNRGQAFAPGDLRRAIAEARKTAQALGQKDPGVVAVYIGRDEPSARLAEAARIVTDAGESQLDVLVEAAIGTE